MKLRPTTLLVWEVKEESNDNVTIWPPQLEALERHASSTQRHWRPIIFAVTLLLLASFISGKRLMDQAEYNIAQTERAIELAIEADSLRRDPVAPKPDIQSIELQNDLAIVQMSVDDDVSREERPAAYGTVFYRQSAKGWVRIEAKELEWGAYHNRETPHILFQYNQLDHTLVATVAPVIESFYTDLYSDLGLELPPNYEKVVIRIAIVTGTQRADPCDLVGYAAWVSDGIVVLSPSFMRVSAPSTNADTLRQTLYATLAYRLILLALQEHQPQVAWRSLVDGLKLWAYSAHCEFGADRTNDLNHRLRQRLANEMPMRLPVLSVVPPPLVDPEETQVTGWQQNVVAKTITDYMIATYGRGSLARLLDGMHQHDSWQSLIPAVFGISMEEFESGWQAYLAAQYTLPP